MSKLLQNIMSKLLLQKMPVGTPPTTKPVEPPTNPAVSAGEGELRREIEELKAEVDLWKDRCMAAEQALDATIEHYNRSSIAIGGSGRP